MSAQVSETADPLTREERDGLTVWGETFSAQLRTLGSLDGSESEVLVLVTREGAPRSSEDGHPVLLPEADADKLRALLNAGYARRAR